MTEQAEMREMLELAALAVGIKVRCFDNIETLILEVDELIYWNPHTDDGDSRRLQVALGIDLIISLDGRCTAMGVAPSENFEYFEIDEREYDAGSNARLAVLKVAADIGRRMKATGNGDV